MKLVLAEKPSVAQSIAKVLGAATVSYTHLALRTVRLITKQGGNRLWTAYSNRSQTG